MARRHARHRGDEHVRVSVLRPVQDLVGRAELDEAALLHDGDAVGDLGDDAEIVRDEEDTRAVLRRSC